jgi:endonuclease YncB( thermonuclease family)
VGAERLIGLVLLAVVASGCQSGGGSEDTVAAGNGVVVEWVNDGDTLTLTDGAKVRLVQVDAPELTTDCYGRPALQELIDLAPKGTHVTLVGDPALDDRDQYGRLLRYVFVDDRNVNVELVERGAASPYYFRNERGRYADELDVAVDEARDSRAGYWGACPDAELNAGIGSVTGPA